MNKYYKPKEVYHLVLYGRNDTNRNNDGTTTEASLKTTTQTRDLTSYITTYESPVINSKILKFDLNQNFCNKRLSENARLYLNSYTLPILNNIDKQYFTNLKLISGGDNTNDYNNISNDDVIIATNYQTSLATYYPELTPSITTTRQVVSDVLLGGVISEIITTYTTVVITKGATTTVVMTEVADSAYTNYLTITSGGNSVFPTKILFANDWYYQLTNTNQITTITTSKPILVDILMVGSGGYGGLNSQAGGGAGGEIIYVKDYLLPIGVYDLYVENHLSYTPTDVRQYPPKPYTSITSRSGSGPYSKTMTLDNTTITTTYGNGDYIIGYSSYYSDAFDAELTFNRNIIITNYYLTADNRYNINTGLYTGSNYLATSNYKGEWVYIRLPVAISLCYYNIVAPFGSSLYRAPSLFKIYGSNDGINWEEITQASNDSNALTDVNYPSYFGIGYSSTVNTLPRYKKILSSPSKLFQYFGMVINKIISNNSPKAPGIMEWELFGFEDAYSNSIPKLNILSHYRDLIPKIPTSTAYIGTTTNNGSTNYKYSITLDSSGVEANETGTYEIVATGSGAYTVSHPYNILSRTTNASSFVCNTSASYNSSGVYAGSRYLESASYKGEWYHIKLPSVRLLYGFSIMNGAQSANLLGEWKFYGSMSGNDGSWTEIPEGSQSTRITANDYVQNGSYWYITKYFTNPTSYLYYGFCCNKLTTTGTFTLIWGNELYLLTKDVLTITDKPSLYDGEVSLLQNGNILLQADAGGDGGYLTNIGGNNTIINPSSGGSGGGGWINGASAGTPFSTTLYPDKFVSGNVSNGGNADLLKGGDGGQATTTSYDIIGSSVSYGLKGTGATVNSSPSTKTGYGMGADGNGGLPTTGTIIIRFKEIGTISKTSAFGTVYQPQILTYNHDYMVNYSKLLLNSYKVPTNLLSKGYLEFEINTLQSGGTVQFLQDELDRVVIDCSIIDFE